VVRKTFMKKKKCLVSGGAGYLGSVLCKTLIDRGFDIKIYDKFYFGRKSIENLMVGNNEFIEGDIRDLPEGLFDNVSAVIHLAGLSNDPTANFNPKMNKEINTDATVSLAKKAKKAGVKRFIFASTASIYDMGIGTNDNLKDENSTVKPMHPYSSSKYEAEKQLLKLNDENFAVVILRKGTIHGYSPRMRYDLVVNIMVRNILIDRPIRVFCKGVQWRPLIDIRDVVEAYRLVLTVPSKLVSGEIFNVTENNYQIKDLAKEIHHVATNFDFKSEVVFEDDDKKDRSYRISNKKIKGRLGFVPRFTLEDSIKELIKRIKEDGVDDLTNPIHYNIKWMEPIFKKECL